MAVLIKLNGVSKSFIHEEKQVDALAGIDLAVAEAEFVTIVGPSGCGKTTLLRLMAGLTAPSRGKIEWDGQVVTGIPRDVAMVFQDYTKTLLPWRSARGNVKLALEARGNLPPDWLERVNHYLTLVGLEGFENSRPFELSGGMQQRVAIARALVSRPRLLLMDEPFGALDMQTREMMQDELLRIWGQERTTVILITHDIREALYLGQRVVIMSSHPGRIIQVLTPDFAGGHDRSLRASQEFNHHVDWIWNLMRHDRI